LKVGTTTASASIECLISDLKNVAADCAPTNVSEHGHEADAA
jgi:hypothetical protein